MKSAILKHILRSFTQHLSLQIATLVVLSGVFAVAGVAIMFHQNLDSVLTRWGSAVKMDIFLQEGVARVESVESILNDNPGVESVQYLSKDQALNQFKSMAKDYLPNIDLDGVTDNPLPASYEVTFKKKWVATEYSQLQGLASQLKAITGIDDVSYGQNWVQNYASVVTKFNSLSLSAIVILFAGTILVVGNSIRSSVARRRNEIEVLELVGATRFSIQAPYLIEGLVLGVIAGVGGLMVCYLIYVGPMKSFNANIGVWGETLVFNFLSIEKMSLLLLLAGLFGSLGSYICVRKINSGWAAAESEK